MFKIEIKVSKPPYGFNVQARRDGIRVVLKDILGAERYVLLPPAVAAVLRDELTAALATALAKDPQ
jgi:hypothetical protein